MDIPVISNRERGLSVRTKLNAAERTINIAPPSIRYRIAA